MKYNSILIRGIYFFEIQNFLGNTVFHNVKRCNTVLIQPDFFQLKHSETPFNTAVLCVNYF